MLSCQILERGFLLLLLFNLFMCEQALALPEAPEIWNLNLDNP